MHKFCVRRKLLVALVVAAIALAMPVVASAAPSGVTDAYFGGGLFSYVSDTDTQQPNSGEPDVGQTAPTGRTTYDQEASLVEWLLDGGFFRVLQTWSFF